jgi:hypothetical protein
VLCKDGDSGWDGSVGLILWKGCGAGGRGYGCDDDVGLGGLGLERERERERLLEMSVEKWKVCGLAGRGFVIVSLVWHSLK